jgi:hypothetical protein
MGGYGATLLGLKRPDVFGAVGAISAALSTGTRPASVTSLVAGLAPDAAPYFFIGCGISDSVLPSSRELATQLRSRPDASGTPRSAGRTRLECLGLAGPSILRCPRKAAGVGSGTLRPSFRSALPSEAEHHPHLSLD